MFLIPFLRALDIGHAERDVVEVDGLKSRGCIGRLGRAGLAQDGPRTRGQRDYPGQVRNQLSPAQPAVLEVQHHSGDLILHLSVSCFF